MPASPQPAGDTLAQRPRPPQPFSQTTRAIVQALLAAREPLGPVRIAALVGLELRSVVTMISTARQLLAGADTLILSVETREGNAYVLKVGDRAALDSLIAQPEAPVAAPPKPKAAMLDSITLAPCGYAEWSYRPIRSVEGTRQGGSHVIRRRGEDRTRILTMTDRSNGLCTEQARLEVAAASEDDDAS